MKQILSNVLMVVDDALNISDDANDAETVMIFQIAEVIESLSTVPVKSPTMRIVQDRRQERMKNELEELEQRYLEKEQYIKANKPMTRRLNNSNKFRYHQRSPKLSRTYRMKPQRYGNYRKNGKW
mmetsp:Transcript_130/g.110  ORF Transcript_130/g.110 Transcript_130/m.110 type:complete len:125 (-) Transcript_130:196-570(-)